MFFKNLKIVFFVITLLIISLLIIKTRNDYQLNQQFIKEIDESKWQKSSWSINNKVKFSLLSPNDWIIKQNKDYDTVQLTSNDRFLETVYLQFDYTEKNIWQYVNMNIKNTYQDFYIKNEETINNHKFIDYRIKNLEKWFSPETSMVFDYLNSENFNKEEGVFSIIIRETNTSSSFDYQSPQRAKHLYEISQKIINSLSFN